MTPRERRAARELHEYLVRLYGPEAEISMEALPSRPQHPDRVEIEATVVTPPPPPDPDAPPKRRDAPGRADIVVEIAERYVAVRSARYALNGGLIPVTCDEVTAGLARDFPALFPEGTVEIDVAWQELTRAAAETLAGHQVLDGVVSTQVKQKFGELRWYTGGMPDGREAEVNAILDSASHLSSVICEACGSPGRIRTGGWTRILCDRCAEARRKKR